MSAGWNALPLEREAAHRMWDAGLPRKRIAALLGVSESTVSKWRWQDGWQNRKRYEDRPIREPKRRTSRGPAHSRYGPGRHSEPEPTTWRCPYCGGISSDEGGHSACIMRNRAA